MAEKAISEEDRGGERRRGGGEREEIRLEWRWRIMSKT